jgi:ABC-type branched-subunit amino acid transport system ATPase component
MRVSARGLRAGYGSATIIDGLDLEVQSGGALAVLGRNGMGKTTFVKALLGLLPGTHGSVRFGENDVSTWPTHRIIRLGVGYAPQEENLFSELTVGDNLDVGRAGGAEAQARRTEVLARFPVLSSRLRQTAGTLSGGEQKMLVLARTLITAPSVVILDEISDGLQPAMVSTVGELLREVRRWGSITIIMVEQNVELALGVADRLAVMKRGDLVYETTADVPGVRDELMRELAP